MEVQGFYQRGSREEESRSHDFQYFPYEGALFTSMSFRVLVKDSRANTTISLCSHKIGIEICGEAAPLDQTEQNAGTSLVMDTGAQMSSDWILNWLQAPLAMEAKWGLNTGI